RARDLARLSVRRIGVGGPAEQVAGELVEHDDRGEGGLGVLGPGRRGPERPPQVEKPTADLGVDLRVRAEPGRGLQRLEPEAVDLVDPVVLHPGLRLTFERLATNIQLCIRSGETACRNSTTIRPASAGPAIAGRGRAAIAAMTGPGGSRRRASL